MTGSRPLSIMTSTRPLMITVPFPRNERVARKKEHLPRDPRMPFSNGTLLYEVPGRKLKVGVVLEGLGFIALYGITYQPRGSRTTLVRVELKTREVRGEKNQDQKSQLTSLHNMKAPSSQQLRMPQIRVLGSFRRWSSVPILRRSLMAL